MCQKNNRVRERRKQKHKNSGSGSLYSWIRRDSKYVLCFYNFQGHPEKAFKFSYIVVVSYMNKNDDHFMFIIIRFFLIQRCNTQDIFY